MADPNSEPQGIQQRTVAIRRRDRTGSSTAPTARPAARRQPASRPAARCQPGRRRRNPGANWNAPRMAYTAALTICSTTGRGDAKNRALAGVISAPPASSVRRKAPAASGMALSTSSRGHEPRCRTSLLPALWFLRRGFPPSLRCGTVGGSTFIGDMRVHVSAPWTDARGDVRFTARSEARGPGGAASSPSVVSHRVTIEYQ